MSDARRAGDADPRKVIIADTIKLVSFLFHSFVHKGVGTIYIFTNRKKNLYKFSLISQVGNSGYDKTITSQLKDRNVEYCSDAEASRKVNTPLFRKLNSIPDETYEIESCKKTIKLNSPIQVGFFCISMPS